MSKTTSVSTSPGHTYYNSRLSATPNPDTTQGPLLAKFDDNRTAPLVNKANDYNLSIIRFNTTLQSLPALIVEHPSGTTVNTAYSFTITTGGNDFTTVVQWSPPNASTLPGSGDLFDPYWWEYDYTRFTQFVNTALATATTNAGLPNAPFFQYDYTTATFSLYAPATQFDDATGTAELFADTQGHYLYGGFASEYTNTTDKEFRYMIFNQPGESNTTIGGVQYIVKKQTPGSLCNWNPVRRFVFTSQNIPVNGESLLPQTPYATGVQQNTLATQKIISDMTPELTRGDELRSGTLEYNPSAQYRFADLTSSDVLKYIDFQLYWEDQLGGLHPHYLLHNGFIAVKMLFQRKDLN